MVDCVIVVIGLVVIIGVIFARGTIDVIWRDRGWVAMWRRVIVMLVMVFKVFIVDIAAMMMEVVIQDHQPGLLLQ